MSNRPPPPQVSDNGKFYWDGQRWVPMQAPIQQVSTGQAQSAERPRTVGCVTHTTCLTLVGLAGALALVLLVAGICSSLSH